MKHRLFLLQPQHVFRARINMPTVTYPITELVYDTVTLDGSSNVREGMTLLLGSATGLDDYGRQRVRDNIVTFPSADFKIPIGLTSKGLNDGELDVHDNAYITILDDFRVWSKTPKIIPFGETGLVLKDGVYTSTLFVPDPPPKASAGIGYAGTANPTTGLATIKFSASNSFRWSDAGFGNIDTPSIQWQLIDGAFIVGTDDDFNITATFPPGFRWVILNAYTPTPYPNDPFFRHTMRVPVYVRDPEEDLSLENFIITQHEEGLSGTEMTLLILDDIPRNTYPDGTLAMIWDDEDPPDDEVGRSHMIFIGWMQNEDNSIEPQRTATLLNTSIHLVGVLGRLKKLPGWSQIQEYTPGALQWYETKYPTMLYYLWYLLHWHSTALEVADLVITDQILYNYRFKVLGSDAGSLFDQVNSMANNVTPDHYFTCSRKGQMFLVIDENVQFLGDRNNETVMELGDEDLVSIQYSYDRVPRYFQLKSFAITGGSAETLAIACIIPGVSQGQGISYLETSQRITQNQTQLNIVEGNRYARLNARMVSLSVTLPGTLLPPDYTPAKMEWIELTITKPSHRENGVLTMRAICQGMSVGYEYQRTGIVRTVNLTLQPETSGPAATTFVLEEDE